MSHLPLVILCGKAGAGKDSVANCLVEAHGAATLALADPMKRLCAKVFGFSESQLWGPSENRNAPDPRFHPDNNRAYTDARCILDAEGEGWLEDLQISCRYQLALVTWFEELRQSQLQVRATLTPRIALQKLGTEFGRRVSKDIWINYAKANALKLLSGECGYDRTQGVVSGNKNASMVVITDGRFHNEVIGVKSIGGVAVKIVNPGPIGDMSLAAQKAGVQGHASETTLEGIPDSWYDLVFDNDKSRGLNYLKGEVADLKNSLFPTTRTKNQEQLFRFREYLELR